MSIPKFENVHTAALSHRGSNPAGEVTSASASGTTFTLFEAEQGNDRPGDEASFSLSYFFITSTISDDGSTCNRGLQWNRPPRMVSFVVSFPLRIRTAIFF